MRVLYSSKHMAQLPRWCCSRVSVRYKRKRLTSTLGRIYILTTRNLEKRCSIKHPAQRGTFIYQPEDPRPPTAAAFDAQLYCAEDCRRCTIVILVSKNRSTQLARQSCSFWESVEPGVPAGVSQIVSRNGMLVSQPRNSTKRNTTTESGRQEGPRRCWAGLPVL